MLTPNSGQSESMGQGASRFGAVMQKIRVRSTFDDRDISSGVTKKKRYYAQAGRLEGLVKLFTLLF